MSVASVTQAVNYGTRTCFLSDRDESGRASGRGIEKEKELPLPPTGGVPCSQYACASSTTPSTTLRTSGGELKWTSIGSETPVSGI